jgi:rRNA processing protein Gar1
MPERFLDLTRTPYHLWGSSQSQYRYYLHSCLEGEGSDIMSFSGRVKEASHEGGLLVSFEGKAPRLGASIRISGGKIIGRVDTVLGPVDSPIIHVHPLTDGIDPRATLGSPVEIAPRIRTGQGRSRRRPSSYPTKKARRDDKRGSKSQKRSPRGDARRPGKRGGPGRSSVRKGHKRGVRGPIKRGGPGRSGGKRDSRRKGNSRNRR